MARINLRPFIAKAAEDNDASDYNLQVIKDSQSYRLAQNVFKIVDPEDKKLGKFPGFIIALDRLLSNYADDPSAEEEIEDSEGNENDNDEDEDDKGSENEENEDDSEDDDNDNDDIDNDDDDNDNDRDDQDDTDDENDDD